MSKNDGFHGSRVLRSGLLFGFFSSTPQIILLFLFSAVYNILLLTTPIYLLQVYSRVLTSRSLETLVVLTIAALAALSFATLLDIARRGVFFKMGMRAYHALGERVVKAISEPGAPNGAGPMRDVETVRSFYTGPDLSALMDVPFIPLFLGVLFVIDTRLGLLALALVLIVMALALVSFLISGTSDSARSETQLADEFPAFWGRSVDLPALGLSGALSGRWLVAQAQRARSEGNRPAAFMVVPRVSQAVKAATMILVISLAAFLVLQEELNPGMIFAASILGTRAVGSADSLVSIINSFRRTRDAIRRLTGLLNARKTAQHVTQPPSTGRAEIRGAIVTLQSSGGGTVPVLRGASLQVGAGEIAALVGPPGSGKSVAARLLVGGLAPTSGSVYLDDVDIQNFERSVLHDAVGYLPQRLDALPAGIAETIARFRPCTLDDVSLALQAAGLQASELSSLPRRLDTPMEVAAAELPGSVYKRLLIARAFYGDPKLLVLDEPNSGIDRAAEKAIARHLTAMKEKGCSILLVSPRGELAEIVDKIIFMKNGTVEKMVPRQGTDVPERPRGNPGELRLLTP